MPPSSSIVDIPSLGEVEHAAVQCDRRGRQTEGEHAAISGVDAPEMRRLKRGHHAVEHEERGTTIRRLLRW